MFISKAEKQELHDKIQALDHKYMSHIDELERTLQAMGKVNSYVLQFVDNMYKPAPYGRCKDGTPRLKPGVKLGTKKGTKK